MWMVVVFDDDSVEAVPHNWYKYSSGTCAWPKKPSTTKRKIETRAEPNIFDFDYHNARILRSDIDSLETARKKARRAQDTSDLGTGEDEEGMLSKANRKYNSQKIVYTPQTIRVKKTNQHVPKPPLFDKIHSSRESFSVKQIEAKICNEECNKRPQISNDNDNGNNMNMNKDFTIFNNDSPSSKSLVLSEEDDKDKTCTPTKPCSKYDSVHVGAMSGILTRNSPSGTWHVSQENSIDGATATKSIKKRLDFNSQETPMHTKQKALIQTSTSQNEKRKFIMSEEEFQDKMFRSIKKINYTLQGIDDKLDVLEKKFDTVYNNQNSVGFNINQDEIETNDWPVFNDEQLNIIETKLENDNSYKKLMVKKLRVLNGKDVGDSVRRIMKCMFCDKFLEQYSYIGFKKKRSFSTLLCCRLIFDAIKANIMFQEVLDVTIEKAIKSWLGQAPFRTSKNTQKQN